VCGPCRVLSLYGLYCNRYEKLQDFLRVKLSWSDFGEMLDLPLNRLQRYFLIFREVTSSSGNPDPILLEALTVLGLLQSQGLYELHKERAKRELYRFSNRFNKSIPLYNPTRKLVRLEEMECKTTGSASYETNVVALISDSLLICVAEEENKLDLMCVVTLCKSTLTISDEDSIIYLQYYKASSSSSETICLKPKSVESIKIWGMQLHNAILAASLSQNLKDRKWSMFELSIQDVFTREDRSMSKFIKKRAEGRSASSSASSKASATGSIRRNKS